MDFKRLITRASKTKIEQALERGLDKIEDELDVQISAITPENINGLFDELFLGEINHGRIIACLAICRKLVDNNQINGELMSLMMTEYFNDNIAKWMGEHGNWRHYITMFPYEPSLKERAIGLGVLGVIFAGMVYFDY